MVKDKSEALKLALMEYQFQYHIKPNLRLAGNFGEMLESQYRVTMDFYRKIILN